MQLWEMVTARGTETKGSKGNEKQGNRTVWGRQSLDRKEQSLFQFWQDTQRWGAWVVARAGQTGDMGVGAGCP
jgi:hypothetical protein